MHRRDAPFRRSCRRARAAHRRAGLLTGRPPPGPRSMSPTAHRDGFAPLDAAGPRVVAIGGGHGLARGLGAIRRYACDVAAIVSVADDGGSSGRLREALDIPAPG